MLRRKELIFWSFGCLGHVEEPVSGLGQKQIVDALVFGERSRAVSLLYDFSLGNNKLSANDFASILQTCARLPDPLVSMQIDVQFFLLMWHVMFVLVKSSKMSTYCRFIATDSLNGQSTMLYMLG